MLESGAGKDPLRRFLVPWQTGRVSGGEAGFVVGAIGEAAIAIQTESVQGWIKLCGRQGEG